MRARSLLVPAFLLLTLVPPAQALGEVGEGMVDLDPGTAIAVEPAPGADVKAADAVGALGKDVCVDVTSLFDDPAAVIIIASHCTVMATASIEFSEEGDLVITIAFAYAGFGYSLVLECSDPHNLPKFGDSVVWGSCSPRQLTQGIH